MASAIRYSARIGVVGAWAVILGAAILVSVDRALSLLARGGPSSGLTAARLPFDALLASTLTGIASGGSMAVVVGVLLIAVGWYQLLTLA
ncbi:MAG: hypothetical protein ABEJ76_01575 [Halanaeroarchaeum sp.]